MTFQSVRTYDSQVPKICELTNAELEAVLAAAAQRGCCSAQSDSGNGGVAAHLDIQFGADTAP